MTITIDIWVLPVIITAVIWIIGGVWADNQPSSGMFGNSLEIGFAVMCCIIWSLFTWMIYFAFRLWGWI